MKLFRSAVDPATLERRIRQGRGLERADFVIRNARTMNLFSGQLVNGNIAICGDTIVGIDDHYEGQEEFDAQGRTVVPGFVDTHVHIESSLCTPDAFARCVVPRGTTSVICDPHEIANVCGRAGLQYMLDAAQASCLSIFVQLSSCVPASPLETSGAQLDANDLLAFADHPKVIGLAELMNVPGLLSGDPVVLDKLAAFSSAFIDGHAPLLRGRDLNAYLAAGVMTDHESSSLDEAREKIDKGMRVLIREGSVAKDLNALIGLITEGYAAHLAFCTDDRNPLDIAHEGHIDAMIRRVINAGVEPHLAYRIASLSAAGLFGLHDRGFIGPGYRADLVILDDHTKVQIGAVILGGKPAQDQCDRLNMPLPDLCHTVHLPKLDAGSFVSHGPPLTPVIEVEDGKIVTQRRDLVLEIGEDGRQVDLARDIVKVAVIERHGRSGSIGVGFVTGFGLKRGAIASSVGHDSHNVAVIGTCDADMRIAAEQVAQLQGGFVVVESGRVVGQIALPIAGLMSDKPFDEIESALETLRAKARALGCSVREPFLLISFLPLSVIPHLKVTDQGLVDVDRFALIEPALQKGNHRHA